MIKSLILVLIANAFTLLAFSQDDIIGRNQKLNLPPIDYKSKLINTEPSLLELNVPNYNIQTQDLNLFNAPHIYKMNASFTNIKSDYLFKPQAIRNLPFSNDFNRSKTKRIADSIYTNINSSRKTYFGLGSYLQFNYSLQLKPNNKFSIDFGGLFSRQYNHLTGKYSDIVGLNTQTNYNLTDKLQFNLWGQYIIPSNQNFFYGNSLFPNSNIGSSVSFKIRDLMQLDLGVKYQYYEFKKNWDIESSSKITVKF